MANTERGTLDAKARAFIATEHALQKTRLKQTGQWSREVTHAVVQALVDEAMRGLEDDQADPAIRKRRLELQDFADIVEYGPPEDLFVDSYDDVITATMLLYPIEVIGQILRAFGLHEDGGAEAALQGYQMALAAIPDADLDAWTPDLSKPLTLATQEETWEEYEPALEVFFEGPWPNPEPGGIHPPPDLTALTIWLHDTDDDAWSCRLTQTADGWTFEGTVVRWHDDTRSTFQHPCQDLGQALRAVPWRRVRTVHTDTADSGAVTAALAAFLLSIHDPAEPLPTLDIDGQPVFDDAQREAYEASQPYLTVTRHTPDGATQTHTITGPDPLDQLIAQHLHILRKGEATEYITRGEPDEVLALLHLDPHGGNQDSQPWPDTTLRERYEREDQELADHVADLPVILRWARLADTRLIGLHTPGFPPVLVTVDTAEAEITSGTEVAHYSWFSEGGGAPVSWAGGSRFVDLGKGWSMFDRWGDTDEETTITPGDENPTQLAAHIKDLIDIEDAHVIAALTLEPLDPDDTLPADHKQHWQQTLAEIPATLELTCTEQVLATLRTHLAHNTLYTACKTALANPTSDLGQRLLKSLETAATKQTPSALTTGDWHTH